MFISVSQEVDKNQNLMRLVIERYFEIGIRNVEPYTASYAVKIMYQIT